MNTNKHELNNNDIVYQVVGCTMEVIDELGHDLREETCEKFFIVELKRNNFLKHSKLEWKRVIYTEGESY